MELVTGLYPGSGFLLSCKSICIYTASYLRVKLLQLNLLLIITAFVSLCRFIAPIEGVGLIVWWIVEEILTNSSTWWQFHTESLAVVLTEWAVVILILIGLNWWMKPLVIYEPNDRNAKRVLGFFFKLIPKLYQPKSDLEQSTAPSVPVSVSKYLLYI